jgi:myo-inositol-1(or 4)-monophosphatase
MADPRRLPAAAVAALPEELAALPEFVAALVQVGHQVLLGRFLEPHRFTEPSGHTTDVDLDAEAALIEHLNRLFGSPTILAEEWFALHGRECNSGRRLRVFLDALDGSRHYNARGDRYASTVAFELDGALAAGIVYHPPSETCYLAIRGAGAWMGDDRLRASDRVAPRSVRVQDRGDAALSEAACIFAKAGYQIDRVEGTAITLCRMAAGEHACVLKKVREEQGIARIWGVAAGVLLAREAGLRVLGPDGRAWTPRAGGLIVGDDQAVDLCRRALWRPGPA